jgi:hypothetical protein
VYVCVCVCVPEVNARLGKIQISNAKLN